MVLMPTINSIAGFDSAVHETGGESISRLTVRKHDGDLIGVAQVHSN